MNIIYNIIYIFLIFLNYNTMYNFLQQIMNYPSRNTPNVNTRQRTRTNMYPGASMLRHYYRPQEISMQSVLPNTSEPIFQVNIEVSDNVDNTRDFEEPEEIVFNNNVHYDTSSSLMNDINHIADIVPGNHNATYYLNFPNENANDDSNTLFYTVFESNSHRIQYHHDNILSIEEGNSIYDHILNLLENENNDLESTLHSSFQNDDNYLRQNDAKQVELMKSVMVLNDYESLKSILKNDVCPIEYRKFDEEDEIYMFKSCNHGMSACHVDNYLKTFKKCPLCNKLFIHN